MEAAAFPPSRIVRVRKGQTVRVIAGNGATLDVTRFTSGAVEVRNAGTRSILRAWSPKEAREA